MLEQFGSITTWSNATLDEIISRQIGERKDVEYKSELPGNDYEGVKEFLADISSFANSGGGHILFGLATEEGIPTRIVPIEDSDADGTKLRLENLLRDNIVPRLHGSTIEHIPLTKGGYAVAAHIPHSWQAPHVVHYKKHWRFYSRSAAGKYPMSVDEVREMFLRTSTIKDEIMDFRVARTRDYLSRRGPVPSLTKPALMLHVCPMESFANPQRFDIETLYEQAYRVFPENGGNSRRYNLDGVLAANDSQDDYISKYVQLFRDGRYEYVDSYIVGGRPLDDNRHYIASALLVKYLVDIGKRLVNMYQLLGVSPPLVVLASLLDVKDHYLAHNNSSFALGSLPTFSRDHYDIPEILITDFSGDVPTLLKPMFDMIWNAAGAPRCNYYSADGTYSSP